MTAVTFVICTTGERRSLLDEVVLPGILTQPLPDVEVVVVGTYDGRHTDRVRLVPAPTGGELFHKPFHAGVEAARGEWIVDLDDDMLLAADWAQRLGAPAERPPGVYGFRMLHPDGTTFGTHFDAVDNSRSGTASDTSYFSAYLAPAAAMRRVRYPTYQSGDRVHALRLRAAVPQLPWTLLDDVTVTHLGRAAGHPGLTPKTTSAQVRDLRPLRAFLLEHDVAWGAFADRHLDGRPDLTLDAAWAAARAAVGDPALRGREHWLW